MIVRLSLSTIVLLVLYLEVAAMTPAHAYIDPGSGSYLLQLLLGTVLGGAFALKMYWKQIVERFRGRDTAVQEAPSQETQPSADQPAE